MHTPQTRKGSFHLPKKVLQSYRLISAIQNIGQKSLERSKGSPQNCDSLIPQHYNFINRVELKCCGIKGIKIDDDYWKDNVYYVSRNGFFVDIEGNILVYDKEKDELIIKYLRIEEESEEGYVYLDETYRRYDPNQERLE